MLSYIENEYTSVERKHIVKVPHTWGVFSANANALLYKKATALYNKALTGTNKQVLNACISFINSWKRMAEAKTYRGTGISDTDVREQVYEFAVVICKARGIEVDDDTFPEYW